MGEGRVKRDPTLLPIPIKNHMKLDTGVSNVQTYGTGTDVEGTIDDTRLGLFVKILSQYSDIHGSITRELTTNAFDAHQEARDYRDKSVDELLAMGYEAKVTDPEARIARIKDLKRQMKNWKESNICVQLKRGSDSSPSMIFKDNGIGMSTQRIEEIYSKYLGSTKSGTNSQIGAFGLGSKSPLGYTDMFYVTTRFDGTEYSWIVRKGAIKPIYTLAYSKPTDEKNGTTVEIPIKEDDKHRFILAIKNQLSYFDDIDYAGIDISPYEVYRGKHFYFRTNSPFQRIHLVIGRVAYPLNTQIMGIMHDRVAMIPVGLWFSMEEIDKIDIMWGRENVEYTPRTITAIKEKIKLFHEEVAQIAKDKSIDTSDFVKHFQLKAAMSEKRDLPITESISIPYAGMIASPTVNYTGIGKGANEYFSNLVEVCFNSMYNTDKVIGAGGRINIVKNRYESLGKLINLAKVIRNKNHNTFFILEPGERTTSQKNRYIEELTNGRARLLTKTGKENVEHINNVIRYHNVSDADIKHVKEQLNILIAPVSTKYADVVVSQAFKDKDNPPAPPVKVAKKTPSEINITNLECYDSPNGAVYASRKRALIKGNKLSYGNFKFTVYGVKADTDILKDMSQLKTLQQKSFGVIMVNKGDAELVESLSNTVHVREFMNRSNSTYKYFVNHEVIRDVFPNWSATSKEITRMMARLYSVLDSPEFEEEARGAKVFVMHGSFITSRPYSSQHHTTGYEKFSQELIKEEVKVTTLQVKARDLARQGVKFRLPPEAIALTSEKALRSLRAFLIFLDSFPLLQHITPEADTSSIQEYVELKKKGYFVKRTKELLKWERERREWKTKLAEEIPSSDTNT